MNLKISFLISVLFLCTASYSNPNTFTIKGVVNSSKKEIKLVVKKYDISQNIQTALDTILLDQNGAFEKTLPFGSGIYQLDFKGLTKINTAIESGQTVNYSINQDRDMEITTKVSGSKDAELMIEYEQLRKQSFKNWVQPIRKKLKEARNKSDIDLINKFTGEEVRGLDRYIEEITRFAKNKMQRSIAFFFAAIRFNPDKEMPYLENRANWFLNNRPQLFLTKEFAEKVKRYKKIEIGQKAPSFKVLSMEGYEIELSSLVGTFVLLDFWASWCLPCRTENLNYSKLYKTYKKKGFEIFGVALETNNTLWAQASKKDGIHWVNTSELNGWKSEIAKEYNVTALPANFLIDKNGFIIAKNLRGSSLQKKLKDLFD